MLEYSLEEVTPPDQLGLRKVQLEAWENFATMLTGKSGYGWDHQTKIIDRLILFYGPAALFTDTSYALVYCLNRNEVSFRDVELGNYQVDLPCAKVSDVYSEDNKVVVDLPPSAQGTRKAFFSQKGLERVEAVTGKKTGWELRFIGPSNGTATMSLDLKQPNSSRKRSKLENVTGFLASNDVWMAYSLREDRIKWLGIESDNNMVSCEEELPFKGTGLTAATFKFLNSL